MSELAANTSAQAILKQREEVVARRYVDDLRVVMSTPEGRRFVWDLFEDVFKPSFIAGAADVSAFNEGARHRALALFFRAQQVAPDLYVTALNEQLEDQRLDRLTREAAQAQPPEDPTE